MEMIGISPPVVGQIFGSGQDITFSPLEDGCDRIRLGRVHSSSECRLVWSLHLHVLGTLGPVAVKLLHEAYVSQNYGGWCEGLRRYRYQRETREPLG